MSRKLTIPVLIALILALFAGNALAVNPAVLYDQVGKFDKSFNQGAYFGAEQFSKEFGVTYQDFTPTNESQYEQAMRRFASHGNDLIVVVGFSYASVLEKIAPEFPGTRFVIVDMVVDQPNVQSIIFKEHEGSFLVGMLAAMKSQTGKVGFVGGHGHPPDPQVRFGLQGRRAVCEQGHRGLPEHDRHHPGSLGRPDQGR